jgi:hypothetical protein
MFSEPLLGGMFGVFALFPGGVAAVVGIALYMYWEIRRKKVCWWRRN